MQTKEIFTQAEYDVNKDFSGILIIKKPTEKWINLTGNATVKAFGNATVEALDNATVEAWGNATVLKMVKSVIAECFGNASSKLWEESVYTIYDLKKMTDQDENGEIILYKCVDPETSCDFRTGTIKYEIGKESIAPDWVNDNTIQCGNGLHLSPTALGTLKYNSGKVLKCLVSPNDVCVYASDISKVRCRAVRPIAVVNLRGEEIKE